MPTKPPLHVGPFPSGPPAGRSTTIQRTSRLSVAWSVVLLVTALVATPAWAGATEEQRAILDLSVNGIASGQALVILQPADVLVDVTALHGAGLRDIAGRREMRLDVEFVSLASLVPAGMRYELDLSGLALRVTAPPALFGATSLSLRESRPPDLRYPSHNSAFLNYAVTARPGSGTDVSAEAGLHLFGALMQTTVTRTSSGDLLRGLTQITYDDRSHLRRWTFGETQANLGVLGGGGLVLGATVAREYALDPYFVRYPTLGFTGALATPSVLEVYVNDQLVRREELPPGELKLSQLAVPQGSGAARFVVRDAFGREQTFSSSYYLTNSVLSQGMQEYRYTVGAVRQDLGASNVTFGPPALLAYHRVGITNSFTAGFRAEGTPELASAGPVINARLWRYGEIELAVGASRQHGRTGGAYSAGYSYNARRVSLAGSVRSYSPSYATLSLSGPDTRPAYEANAMLGMQINSWLSVAVNHSQVTTQGADNGLVGGDRQRRTWVSARSQVGRMGLFANVTRSTAAGIVSNDVEVGVSLSLGARTSATVTGSAGAAPGHLRAEVQQALPLNTGVGYRLRLSDQSGNLGGGVLQYQNKYGRYEVEQVQAGGTNGTTLRAAGGLVAIGGGVFATRPVEESFALIRVPGVAGVRGYASHQEIGRTDRHGNLLIPNLLPYYGNIVSVNDQDVPLDYKLGDLLQRVAPPFRSGAVVTFSATRVLAVTGTVSVEVAGEAVVPAFGQLTVVVAGESIESPIGQLGEFYLEGIPPGRHQASLEYRGGTGTCIVDVPTSTAVVVKLGPITCK